MNRNDKNTAKGHFTVAIVGGGFTGATLAAQLLRRAGRNVSIGLIERGDRLGRGVAYGTDCWEHLLNVPAKNMSAFPDDPEHFLRWVRATHHLNVKPGDFLPRRLYGRYIASLLKQQIELHPGQLEHLQDEAVSLRRVGGMTAIRLRGGQTIFASKMVLALGNFPPSDPPMPGKSQHSQRYVSNPWTPGTLGDVAQLSSILPVGSGLTSVDVAIALRGRGFSGTIHMLSRHGQLPQSHQTTAPWPSFWDERSPRTARGLLRLIRSQILAAERLGSGWRAVIDSLRPFTQEIWRSLPHQERRRFRRHVRPYWEVHRHRVAPQISERLARQMQNGQMATHAGRITNYCEDVEGVAVTYRDRETGEPRQLCVDRVINCTGPEVDCRRIENPLLTDLRRQQMVYADPLFLGFEASEDGALLNARGEASDFLFTVGPARKGHLWETTAVPELRAQVSEMANLLLAASEQQDTELAQREAIEDLYSAV